MPSHRHVEVSQTLHVFGERRRRSFDAIDTVFSDLPIYVLISLTAVVEFFIYTVIHRIMTHHHTITHSYNITHEHHFFKTNKLRHSNILNDPPHKISSKMNNFWMYYSQIIFGCYVFPPNETPMFTCSLLKNHSLDFIFWKSVLVDFRQIVIFFFSS